MSQILGDLRFALRSLGRARGFSVVAIVTLALGIGANTSMFGVLNTLILRPAPYPDSGRLDRIYRATPQSPRGSVAPADYLDLKREAAGYGDVAAYAFVDMNLSESGTPAEMVLGLRASANLFSTLGSVPRLGRSFRPDEDARGNERVLILSHACWRDRFGSDEHIVGRTVRVDGAQHEVVGVLPQDFSDWRHLGRVDLFRPLALDDAEIRDRSATWLRLVGRHSSSFTGAQAEGFIAGFGRRLAAEHPADHADSTWVAVAIEDTLLPRQARSMIGLLVALSGFVLLIACSNLANLLLARTMARARELAVRSALGASRSQMLRPLFVESLLLAFAGGVCSLFVARWTLDALAGFEPRGDVAFTVDWHVLGWAFGACLATAVAFGVAPALFALRLDPNTTLKSGARGNTGGRGHQRFRNALIVGQFALAMVLLAGAALFVRGLHELNNRRYGWEPQRLVTGSMLLPTSTYPGDTEVAEVQRLVVERLEALPGVASASVSGSMPFFGLMEARKYVVAGREPPPPGHEPAALVNGVSPHYFETVGTRLLAGRTFHRNDTLASPRVFVVNEAMARGLFGNESPIGRRIARAGGDAVSWGEIVGVVGDVQSVSPDPSPVSYQLYQPVAQEPRRSSQIAVRTAGVDPSSIVGSIRATLMALDRDVPIRQLEPAEATIARANDGWGVVGRVLSALALLGLGLASLGVYGVIARTVAQRTGEFGIRLALGAQAGDITRLVLTSGAKLALVGSALGLLGAFGVARLIAAGFPGMRTNSLPVLIGATLLLSAVAQLAGYIPARNASRINPTEALRAE